MMVENTYAAIDLEVGCCSKLEAGCSSDMEARNIQVD